MSEVYTPPFGLGDKVYKIHHAHAPKWVDCSLCGGNGNLQIGPETRKCPDCYGSRGRTEYLPECWRVVCESWEDERRWHNGVPIRFTIGQVRLTHTKTKREKSLKWEAMCLETGVGSGTIHDMDHFYPDLESAQTACESLNAEANNAKR